MTKEDRHKAIGEIIKNKHISSQNMLLDRLIQRGFDLTQATLSRDIKEMKIIKAPISNGDYTYQFAENISYIAEENSSAPAIQFLSFDFSGNLAVAKTRPGYAMAIAGEIDSKGAKTILGTVAGDDTILLIIREGISRKDVLKALADFIPDYLVKINTDIHN